ncbi:MAG: hypothetical protein E7337_00285 [Clostridiales bacterium]|nr:hypothetical protein [Clostridiales bacterium]
MKIFNVNNLSAFFGKILECDGNVYYRDEHGTLRDLKHVAEQYFACKWPFQSVKMDEIDIVVDESADCRGIYRYMMEAR